MKRLAVLGQPGRPFAVAGDADGGAGGARARPEWGYEAIELPPEDFADLAASSPGRGFVGANVTIPTRARPWRSPTSSPRPRARSGPPTP